MNGLDHPTLPPRRGLHSVWFLHQPDAPAATKRLAGQLQHLTRWCRANSTRPLVVIATIAPGGVRAAGRPRPRRSRETAAARDVSLARGRGSGKTLSPER